MASRGKSVEKSVPPQLTPFRKDDKRKRGRGPAKGAPNAGRPPDAFKEMCRQIASRGARALLAKQVMTDPTHEAFSSALKWATDHGYGKAPQSVELTGKGGRPLAASNITVTFVRKA